MNNKIQKIFILILSIVIFSVFSSAALTATTANIEGFIETNVTGTITITNTGNTSVSGISVLPNGFAPEWNFQVVSNAATSIVSQGSTTYQFQVTVPTTQASNLNPNNIGTFTVSGTGQNDTTSQAVFTLKPRLKITTVRIDVEGDTEKVSQGENIETKRGDSISLEIEIDNQYSRSSNIDFENVDITVYNDNLNIDEDNEFDVNSGDEETITFNFIIEDDADDSKEEIEIKVEGYDDNGVFHTDIFTFDLEINVPNREVSIRDASFAPSIVSCSRTTTLNVDIKNTGRNDLDQAMIIVESAESDLEYTQWIKGISLDEGDSYQASFKITIPESQNVGAYLFNIRTYYDSSTTHKTDNEIANIEIVNCVNTDSSSSDSTTDDSTSNGSSSTSDIVVNTGSSMTIPSGAVFASEKSSFSLSENTGLIMLILVNLVLIIIVIGAIVAVMKSNKE